MELCPELLNWNKKSEKARRQRRAFYFTNERQDIVAQCLIPQYLIRSPTGHGTHVILIRANDLNDSNKGQQCIWTAVEMQLTP